MRISNFRHLRLALFAFVGLADVASGQTRSWVQSPPPPQQQRPMTQPEEYPLLAAIRGAKAVQPAQQPRYAQPYPNMQGAAPSPTPWLPNTAPQQPAQGYYMPAQQPAQPMVAAPQGMAPAGGPVYMYAPAPTMQAQQPMTMVQQTAPSQAAPQQFSQQHFAVPQAAVQQTSAAPNTTYYPLPAGSQYGTQYVAQQPTQAVVPAAATSAVMQGGPRMAMVPATGTPTWQQGVTGFGPGMYPTLAPAASTSGPMMVDPGSPAGTSPWLQAGLTPQPAPKMHDLPTPDPRMNNTVAPPEYAGGSYGYEQPGVNFNYGGWEDTECDDCDGNSGQYQQGRRGPGPWFVAVSGLYLTRNASNSVEMTWLGPDHHGAVMTTEQVGLDQWVAGVETRVGRSLSDCFAFEAVYWSVEGMDAQMSVRSVHDNVNARQDFENIWAGCIFCDAREQRLSRGTSFENFELNLLKQSVAVDCLDRFGVSVFGGLRYFRFDEVLGFQSVEGGFEFSDNIHGTQGTYMVREQNRMWGAQFGGRGHVRVGQRVRLFAMPRFGVFANNIEQRQFLTDRLDVQSSKTDVTLMGQIDLGASFQVTPRISVYGSYRAMGFAGVATADDNIIRTFYSHGAPATINSSSSLILHGWQAGMQFQF